MRKKKAKALYVVAVKLPPGVTASHMKFFIKEAVETWSGQLDPQEDPLFGFNRCSVKLLIEED